MTRAGVPVMVAPPVTVAEPETTNEALAAAAALLGQTGDLANETASWIAPCVWVGDGSAPAERTPCLIGAFDELAARVRVREIARDVRYVFVAKP